MQHFNDLLIDDLLDRGFTLNEAEKLILLQEHTEMVMRRIQKQKEFEYWVGRNEKGPNEKNC